MQPSPIATFGRTFDLDAGSGILSDDSAASIEVGLATDADIVAAIRGNQPFPERPSGKIELGRVQLTATAGKDISFNAPGANVLFTASAGVSAGLGIYNNPSDAVAALALDETPGLDLNLRPGADHRFLLLRWGYQVAGSGTGRHPLGALGSLTFGVDGRHEALYAVIHRFPATQGSHDAIRNTAASWRLPRQVNEAANLAPGTWLVAETEGQVAVDLAAQLGYDFTFVRELKSVGLSGDVGLKIDAAARAVLGFEVSGRYVLALGREEADPTSQKLRLRLFKLNKKGHSFGLNLAVGVRGITEGLPDQVDDLVKAIFGVHGRQIVKDLLLIEQWTDPTKDLSDTVAALVNRTGLELLQRTTGIDPAVAFNDARARLLEHLRLWDGLPDNVAAATWRALELISSNDAAFQDFSKVIDALADPDERQRSRKLAGFIADAAAPLLPEVPLVGRIRSEWLAALADRGLLSLMNQLGPLHNSAVIIQQILNGGVIRNLQSFIGERLDLEALRTADFAQIDAWLVNRLSQFLDERVDLSKLEEIRTLINTVVKKRQEVYASAKAALGRRYSAELAAVWSKTTASSAVLDVEFDLSEPSAKALYAEVIDKGALDGILTTRIPGTTLHDALLTHGIERKASVEVNLPYFSSRRDRMNKTLASVAAHDDGNRVLMYQVDASDTVSVRNRLRSQLAVGAAFPVQAAGNLRVRSTDQLSWSYQYVSVQESMRRADVDARVAPFLDRYMPDKFAAGGPGSLDTWLTDLDRAAETALHNGSNEFGDTIIDMQVSVPGHALAAWFLPRTKDELRQDSMEMSCRLQAGLKELIPFYFLQEPSRLRQNATVAALLTWAAIPPSTSVQLEGSRLTIDTREQPYWNHVDPSLRRAMAGSAITAARLSALLGAARKRLLEAGQTQEADFFVPSETVDFQSLALTGAGEALLTHLLFFESRVVEQSVNTLEDIAGFLDDAQTAPSRSIERLAAMGASITDAFHGRLSTVYGGDAARTLGSLVFLEATAALDPSLRNVRPNSLLRILVLKRPRTFVLADYLRGSEPPPEEVAVTQTLASLAVV